MPRSNIRTIEFTPEQASAIRHRLEAADCIRDVFEDTPSLAHLATSCEAASSRLLDQLDQGNSVKIDKGSEVDRELLREAIEGSTWAATCEMDSAAERGARRTLTNAARKIEDALGLPEREIQVPEA